MGADLLLCWTPLCEATEDRQAQFRESLRAVPDSKLVDECQEEFWFALDDLDEESPTYTTDAAEYIRDEFTRAFREHGECRDCTSVAFPGMDYWMLVTGGMSWGDSPTESFRDVEILGAVPADTYRLLEQWAKEDFAAHLSRTPVTVEGGDA